MAFGAVENSIRPRRSPVVFGAAFNTVTRSVAAERGAFFVDGAAEIPQDLQHHVDGVHYTKAGARLLAETIAETILDRRMINE